MRAVDGPDRITHRWVASISCPTPPSHRLHRRRCVARRADPPQAGLPALPPTLRGGSAAALGQRGGCRRLACSWRHYWWRRDCGWWRSTSTFEGFPTGVLLPVAGFAFFAIVALAATDPPVLVRALACEFAGFAIYFALRCQTRRRCRSRRRVPWPGTVWWWFLAGRLLCLTRAAGPGSRSGRGWSPSYSSGWP